jgi:hypothetical protein
MKIGSFGRKIAMSLAPLSAGFIGLGAAGFRYVGQVPTDSILRGVDAVRRTREADCVTFGLAFLNFLDQRLRSIAPLQP